MKKLFNRLFRKKKNYTFEDLTKQFDELEKFTLDLLVKNGKR